METYVALRDCFWEGLFLKKGETTQVAKGTVVEFELLKKVTEEVPVSKGTVSKK